MKQNYRSPSSFTPGYVTQRIKQGSLNNTCTCTFMAAQALTAKKRNSPDVPQLSDGHTKRGPCTRRGLFRRRKEGRADPCCSVGELQERDAERNKPHGGRTGGFPAYDGCVPADESGETNRGPAEAVHGTRRHWVATAQHLRTLVCNLF